MNKTPTLEERTDKAQAELEARVKEEVNQERLIHIPLAQIKEGKGLQARKRGLKEETVLKYMALYEDDPESLPPVNAFYEETIGVFWVWNGWHRIEAKKRLGGLFVSTIPALVRPGTKDDAIEEASSANAKNGLERTSEDDECAVQNLLTEVPKWRQKSDREIARRCALPDSSGHKRVARIYAKLVEAGAIPAREGTRLGADGRSYDTSNIGKSTGSMTQSKAKETPASPLENPSLPLPEPPKKEASKTTEDICGWCQKKKPHGWLGGRLCCGDCRELAREGKLPITPEPDNLKKEPSSDSSLNPSDPISEPGTQEEATKDEEDRAVINKYVKEHLDTKQETGAEADASAPKKGRMVKVKCPSCKGKGEILLGSAGPRSLCLDCRGTGIIEAELAPGETNGNGAHVGQATGESDWYTPEPFVEAARVVMGDIDLDPASCEVANQVVKAKTYYTKEQDGLTREWFGRLWMNCPYSPEVISRFVERLVNHFVAGVVTQACVVSNNATETQWFARLATVASAVCFPEGRIRFWHPERGLNSPLQGQAILYLGPYPKQFINVFGSFGWCGRVERRPVKEPEKALPDPRQAALPGLAEPPKASPQVEEKVLTCPICCEYSAATPDLLQEHINEGLCAKEEERPCALCKKIFPASLLWLEHNRNCEFCGPCFEVYDKAAGWHPSLKGEPTQGPAHTPETLAESTPEEAPKEETREQHFERLLDELKTSKTRRIGEAVYTQLSALTPTKEEQKRVSAVWVEWVVTVPRKDWLDKALDKIAATTTEEECSEVCARLQMSKNPGSGTYTNEISAAGNAQRTKLAEEAKEKGPSQKEETLLYEVWVKDEHRLNATASSFKKEGHLVSGYRREVPLLLAQYETWAKDERLIVRPLDWLERSIAKLKEIRVYEVALAFHDQMIDLSYNSPERDDIRDAWNAWRKADLADSSPWVDKALADLAATTTREECDKVKAKLIERTQDKKEKGHLAAFAEEHRIKLPSAENVRSPRPSLPKGKDRCAHKQGSRQCPNSALKPRKYCIDHIEKKAEKKGKVK